MFVANLLLASAEVLQYFFLKEDLILQFQKG